MLPTLLALQHQLDQGETTSVALTEAALARIAAPEGEGSRAFTKTYRTQAMAAAQASDTLRAAGLARSPIDGLPVSIKDLFDVAGETTLAGSVVLKQAAPATRSAAIVQRLVEAGAVIVGRTNMTEFAFSGLGLNPHYGTPSNPWDRGTRRIPGGSSSGAGVSVADRMCVAAIGTDTGGSVRIPSAFCGLTGFKPTAHRIPAQGALPLSTSLDSIGPLAASVTCCAILDAILSGQAYSPPVAPALRHLRLAVPTTLVLDGADEHVSTVFHRTLETLKRLGAQIEEIAVPEFEQLAYINRAGGFTCSEAWAWHQKWLADHAEAYDPRVSSRIMRGKSISAADYIELLQSRREWIDAIERRLEPFDALLMPTVPVIAPAISDLQASDDAYYGANGLILRNSTFINFLDGCALSIPCHPAGTAPVGLMIAGVADQDSHILNVGLALEKALSNQ
ncbi:amidase [Candidimonas sp. SYP-B2681]|uniref:amidase n=1 Tax=Candidimonas sp. SYP-B2681 TaxID=2497686 RepID=UPI000F87EE1B|nr:amidase [Candidimonas sp. SYP-B2681]RTZ41701.1 amidase [Candidimonas sp. SYP-B2681]